MKNHSLVKSILSENINWDLFFTLVRDLGSSLNESKLRFIKSDLLEQALQFFFRPCSWQISWVNKIGWDHELRSINGEKIKLEMKFSNDSLRTKKHRRVKETTTEIRLKNVLGNTENQTYSAAYDFLVVCDIDAIALFEKSEVESQLKSGDAKDAFIAKLEIEESRHFITKFDSSKKPVTVVTDSFVDKYRNLQEQHIKAYLTHDKETQLDG